MDETSVRIANAVDLKPYFA